MEGTKPVHVIRYGRIKATIWLNQSPNGEWYNVQVYRSYTVQTQNGEEWRQTTSFGRDDLPLVCKAIDQAHTWIYEQARPRRNGADTPDLAPEQAIDSMDAAPL